MRGRERERERERLSINDQFMCMYVKIAHVIFAKQRRRVW